MLAFERGVPSHINYALGKIMPSIFARRLVAISILLLLSACAGHDGPDRTDDIQLPPAWFVLLAPMLSFVIRKLGVKFIAAVLIAQLVAYVIYETGVSSSANIRIDIFLFGISFLVNIVFLALARPMR